MPKQNIYDDETFFEGYQGLRRNPNNANDLFETPALLALLPDLTDKAVLDLGCGCGAHCAEFARRGARRVLGVDISAKMLETAKRENAAPRVEYRRMAMEDIGGLDERFDAAVSSLAIHYVEDYAALVRQVYALLNPGGVFIFSQEHPLNTCFSGGERWTKDERGEKLFANVSNYSVDGERESRWFVDGVKKYHRTFSSVLNGLTEAGFIVERLVEPVPDEDMQAAHPEHRDLLHKPDFLLVKARKAGGYTGGGHL